MVQKSNSGNRGFLSEEANEEGLYPIHGIAIGNNDITVGNKSKEPKLWRPSVLEESAATLEGKDIVVNHENQDAYELIGKISDVKYDEEKGVIYRGVIDNAELAKKIDHGWLEVSPRILHSKKHEMVEDVKVPEAIYEFDNLSIVRKGAAGSNRVDLGEDDELSVEELQKSFETDDEKVVDYQRMVNSFDVEEMDEHIEYVKHFYETPEAATGAAQGLGCESFHEHVIQGKKWYVPCDTHDSFLRKLKESKSEETEDSEETEENIEEFAGEVDWSEEELETHMEEMSRSKEEMRIASQLASHSSLTKMECLSLLDVFNPERETNVQKFAVMLRKVMEDDEMSNLLSEMRGGTGGQKKDSILNRLV